MDDTTKGRLRGLMKDACRELRYAIAVVAEDVPEGETAYERLGVAAGIIEKVREEVCPKS